MKQLNMTVKLTKECDPFRRAVLNEIRAEKRMHRAHAIFSTRSIQVSGVVDDDMFCIFKIPKLNGGRYRAWQAIRDGEWSRGDIAITERDGKFKISIPYEEKNPCQTSSVI